MTVRRSVALRRRGGALLLCLAAVWTVGACSSTDTSAPSMADIRGVLAQHAAAVRHHDRGAFVAGLDPAAKAAGFRTRQLHAFANLAKLPLSSWSYVIETRTDDRSAERSATSRFGSAAVIVQISLRYGLSGVDRAPASADLWWTFVRDDGHVVIAADNGLAQSGGVSWKGPWDFGPLVVVRGAHSIVLGHPAAAAALDQIARTLASAVPAVTAVWGTGWSQDVAVVVPSSDAELLAQAGTSSQVTTQIAAVAVSAGEDVLSGKPNGQRLIVNPDAFAGLSAVGQQIIVRHEITHIAAAADTTGASPQWLVEGFADYVGNLHSGQSVTTIASELRTDVRKGKLPTALPTQDQFATDGQAAQAYEGSWLACRLIAQRAGQQGLVRFYRLVGASEHDQAGASAAAFASVLHETTAQFTAQWRGYVARLLG
jgi:hypothetical protein